MSIQEQESRDQTQEQEIREQSAPEGPEEAAAEAEIPSEASGEEAAAAPSGEQEALKAALAGQEEKFLRLAAEYDNYRKRSQKEKESAWAGAKAETVLAFLPVYDNLERAMRQETADEAYKKGVEMTMSGLREILTKLGVEEIPALGETFDPNLHNAVMHVEDENAGENTIVEVFQAGFQTGDKVIRFAMVKVAN